MCCDSKEINHHDIKIMSTDLENLNRTFSYPGASIISSKLPIIRVAKDGWVCLSGISLICKNNKKFAGLGDNISSSGFVHHHMKNE